MDRFGGRPWFRQARFDYLLLLSHTGTAAMGNALHRSMTGSPNGDRLGKSAEERKRKEKKEEPRCADRLRRMARRIRSGGHFGL